MLARAMATQGGLNFLHIRGTDIYSKYVGESEKAISRAFSRARQAAPSILFMDEIDTVTSSRDRGGAHGAQHPPPDLSSHHATSSWQVCLQLIPSGTPVAQPRRRYLSSMLL